MYRELELRTSEGTITNVPFKSTGTTSVWFKKFTGKELIPSVNGAIGETHESDDIYSRLAYVMHRQALAESVREMSELNEDEYYEWLDQFEPLTFANNAGTIADIYICNVETSSDAKKNPDQQTDQ